MITDEQIGRNLVALRGDLSQKELADRMRKRGFKWSQATVWAIEKGERPLRLTESAALEAIFDIYEVLAAPKAEFDRKVSVRAFYDKMQQISDLAYESFDRQRRLAIDFDLIPPDVREEGLTPEFIARNAVDHAIKGLARAEAHYRGEREVNELLYGPFTGEGHEFHEAFLAHARDQIEQYRQHTAALDEDHDDGVDHAED